jgi:ACR3 family arsenite efflux pump ArsB
MLGGMTVIDNERTKLTANAFNTIATSCVTVGVVAPLAAVFYNFGPNAVPVRTVVLGVVIWLVIAIVAHYNARLHLGRLRP